MSGPCPFYRYRRYQHEWPCRNSLKRTFHSNGIGFQRIALTRHLTDLGAVIHYGQKAENITDDIDVVVYTAAVHADNPEFIAAKEHQLPMLTRAELLGQLMTNYKTPIAVSGTHGKTTTTSMISHILLAGDTDPTILCRRYFKDHRRKYPRRSLRCFHYRSL